MNSLTREAVQAWADARVAFNQGHAMLPHDFDRHSAALAAFDGSKDLALDLARALLAAMDEAAARPPLGAVTAPEDWQPTTTAPKDGREVALLVRRAGALGGIVGHWLPGGHCIEDHPPIAAAWYFWNGAAFDHAPEPLGWAPLPEKRR